MYTVYRMHTSIEYTGCTNVYRIIQYVYSIQDAHIYRVYRMHQCIQNTICMQYTGCANVYRMHQCKQDALMYTVYRMRQCIAYRMRQCIAYRMQQCIQDVPMYTGCTNVYRLIHNVYRMSSHCPYTPYKKQDYFWPNKYSFLQEKIT